jgi:predicted transcriptional regulator
MTKHITVELTEAQEAHLRAEAERQAVTPEAMMATWVQRQVDYDAWFCAEVQKGIDAADRGEFIPHEEVVARAEVRRAELLAAKSNG